VDLAKEKQNLHGMENIGAMQGDCWTRDVGFWEENRLGSYQLHGKIEGRKVEESIRADAERFLRGTGISAEKVLLRRIEY
jgi:hypothetical protein